ncbi:MAG: tryptophan synthase subunit alpha [Anaerolineae bacterium]|nr:tryptophan synthase subunit alpha [Anaerolineae bacterium]
MSQIEKTFQHLQTAGRTALMPYLTLGYPERDSALTLVPAIAEAGADLIELGIPFSDPLADGPTIQASSQKALENGMTLSLCLEQASSLRARGVTIPFVLMGYYNPIYQFGIGRFAAQAAASGADGVIIPDLPPEEAHAVLDAFESQGLDLILLLAPTSNATRIRMVAELARGFIYLVSLVGTTGARGHVAGDLPDFVDRVRAETDKPLAVGFGISTPDQAAQVAGLADGVIVGSALINVVGAAESPEDAAREFIAALRGGVDAS